MFFASNNCGEWFEVGNSSDSCSKSARGRIEFRHPALGHHQNDPWANLFKIDVHAVSVGIKFFRPNVIGLRICPAQKAKDADVRTRCPFGGTNRGV